MKEETLLVPIRIYALAKELGIENKQLVGVCERAGIKGKGSALASLNDDEVVKVKEFLSESAAPAEEKSKPAAPQRSATPEVRKPPTILDKPRKKVLDLDAKPAAPKAKEPEASEPATAEPATAEPATAKPEPKSPRATSPLAGRVNRGAGSGSQANEPNRAAPVQSRRDVVPSSSGGPVRNLDTPSKKTGGTPNRAKTAPARGPRVAAMPEVKQPTKAPTSSGPKVHRPDISLTRDAMEKKVAAAGSAPLSGHVTDSKKKDRKKSRGSEVAESDGKGKTRRNAGANSESPGSTRQSRPRRGGRGRPGQDDRYPRRAPKRRRSTGKNTAAPRKENVVLEMPCSVRSFCEATGVPTGGVLKSILKMGTMANINSELDEELVDLLIEEFEVEIEVRSEVSLEEKLIDSLETQVDDEADLIARPPVITFLGHVDHGKTSLLDALIGINVVDGEAGGITQHIRAYSIDKDGKKIAFVDTPGHEAFTEMRARGANVTDIAVLVVAADDGVMPQTEEAISHAKAAGVPIIVALNKIDVPNANPDKAMQDLVRYELMPSEWGGDIEVVKTSAIRGDGLEELLETILVTAELHEYKANPNRSAIGTCLEAQQEPGRGVVAKVIVQNGTMNVGDVVVCGAAHGRVKAMFDTLHKTEQLEEAGPSTAVDITGFDIAPEAGDRLHVLDDITEARELAELRSDQTREQGLSGVTVKVSLDDFQQRLESGSLSDSRDELIKLNLIIRADVRGSIEAIQKEISKLQHPEVEIRILQASVGGITVGDVTLASASSAVIIGFNVVPDDAARSLADDRSVEIRRYDIIYKVTDDIKATLEGRLKPEKRDVDVGSAMVLRTFSISRSGTIAGCRVMRGTIERNCRIRLIRDSRVIGDYAMESLRREKDDAKEVRQGMECGIKLAGYNDIKEADTLEAYKTEEIARTLDD